MTSPFDTVLTRLSDGLLVLVEAIALSSRPPQEVTTEWMEASRVVQELYTELRIYKALFTIRSSGSALINRDSPALRHFGDALATCNDAVRGTVAQLSSERSLDAHNIPGTSLNSLHDSQEGSPTLAATLIRHQTELGHSFVLMWLDSLPKSSLIHAIATPLPPSPSNNSNLSTVQSDTSPIPHPKPSRAIFQPPHLTMNAQSLEASLSAALTTAQEAGKQWATRMGIQVDETSRLSPLIPLILGSIFCVLLEDGPSSHSPFAPPIASLRSLVCHNLVGMSEDITSIALLGVSGAGKSLLTDCLVGSGLFISGDQTVLSCRIQHIPGLSAPVLNIVPGPFTFAVEELRRFRFTAKHPKWDAIHKARTPGCSDADPSFEELRRVWPLLGSGLRLLAETIKPSGLEFYPVTTGYDAVRDTLLNLENVVRLCQAFKILIPFDILEWPVLQVEFKPFKDYNLAHSWEILHLPGVHFVITEDDLSLLDRLVQRGSTIVPMINMGVQLSDLRWSCLPNKLNELHIPVPYVIGSWFDVTRHDDKDGEYFAELVAKETWKEMWTTNRDLETEKTGRDALRDRVLPCALWQGFSARYSLDELSTNGKPSFHTAWANKSDPSFWCLRRMFDRKNEDKYNACSIVDITRCLRNILSHSKLDSVIGAIGRVASDTPAEKDGKQLEYLKDQLLKIGQDFDRLLVTSLDPSAGHPSSTTVEEIIHEHMKDLRARAKDAVDTALHDAVDEIKKKWSPERSEHPAGPAFLEDSAEYRIPISALDPFLGLLTSHLQATLPKLVSAWFAEVAAAVALAVPNHGITVVDPASPANATSSLTTPLQEVSVDSREFTMFRSPSVRESQEFEERTRFDSAHNPFTAISRSVWVFLRRMWLLLRPRPAGYHIPSEYATRVYMRMLGEPWLSDLERVALAHVASARYEVVNGGVGLSDEVLFEGFVIRHSIAVALAALQ